MVNRAKRTPVAVIMALIACVACALAFTMPAHAQTDPDSLDWTPVAIPSTPDSIYDGEIPHGDWYVNINMAFNRYQQEMLDYYAEHPEETEGMEEWEITEAAHVAAMWKLEKIRHSLEEDMVIQYFACPDTPDPQYRVKKIMTNSQGTTILYFPRDAGGPDELDDESQYVMEAHDYYRPAWTWVDKDTAYCDFYCMLGQDNFDGTHDYCRVDADSITQTVITKETELTDGEMECTASVVFPETYTYLPTEFTSTQRFPIPASGNPDRIIITEQPQDVTLNYPEGATFHVGINRPDLLVSYQWVQVDSEGRTKVLDGSTATTDTLVIPSSQCWIEEMSYHCVITDINGNKTISRSAWQYIPNYTQEKTVLYVGDYAVEPGETLDLSTTPLGSGIVTFDADGLNITFDNVTINTSAAQYDQQRSPSLGVFLRAFSKADEEYVFHFIGDCVVNDEYWDDEREQGGVAFNADVSDGRTQGAPMIRLEGDGCLRTNGGSNAIYCDCDLEIDIDVTTRHEEGRNCVGIEGTNVHICPDVNIDIVCQGDAIVATGNLFIEDGATVNIDYTEHYTATSDTEAEGILVGGNMVCGEASITLAMHANPELVLEHGKIISNMYGVSCCGPVALYGTELSITMDAEQADQDYAGNFRGITGDPFTGLYLMDGAKVDIQIVSDYIHSAEGVVPENPSPGAGVQLEGGSELNVVIRTLDDAIGLDLSQALTVVDSTVKVMATSSNGGMTFGVIAPEMDVELNDDVNKLSFTATNGVAVFVSDPDFMDATEYDPGYTPVLTTLTGLAKVITPAEGIVSPYGFILPSGMMPGESVYDPAFPAVPAHKVVIATEDSQDEPVSYYVEAGDGQVWDKGSDTAARFVFKRSVDDQETIGHFTDILVDGAVVDSGNYSAKAGSVDVELTPAYLGTLAVGEHSITANFDDADGATASFTVREAGAPDEGGSGDGSGNDDGSGESGSGEQTPKTGDDAQLGLLLAVTLLACAALISCVLVRRRA
ncbi:MAG: hypothetical protein IJJ14_02105 [Coriobacteriales bacterium]|nr:hypothetical protein [Coriobacteriales bacterium]MBQ6586626.1 hypothetical protein [Coriobacteriales bacterium]